MEVISHLYYRMCEEQLPAEERLDAMRSWTGGPKARVPAQRVAVHWRIKRGLGTWILLQIRRRRGPTRVLLQICRYSCDMCWR